MPPLAPEPATSTYAAQTITQLTKWAGDAKKVLTRRCVSKICVDVRRAFVLARVRTGVPGKMNKMKNGKMEKWNILRKNEIFLIKDENELFSRKNEIFPIKNWKKWIRIHFFIFNQKYFIFRKIFHFSFFHFIHFPGDPQAGPRGPLVRLRVLCCFCCWFALVCCFATNPPPIRATLSLGHNRG